MAAIECIPNISEGRRLSVLDTLAATIQAIPDVRLLDHSADINHHRSVFTLIGDPRGLEAAVLALFAVAIADIDLRQHRGVHPRIGAVDVVPFVPLDDTSLDACIALAHCVGRAIADRFDVPVYLYEAAATNTSRQRLEDVRRGQFEGLSKKMAEAKWRPDFGPLTPHASAGATAVGVRGPLIAWNVNLSTPDVRIARAIAVRVRESGGGLPCVKALGVRLDDRNVTQISMNLTNYRTTSMSTVMARIRAEAAQCGVTVTDSQIIGLIPEEALANTEPHDLALPKFPEDHILERQLYPQQ